MTALTEEYNAVLAAFGYDGSPELSVRLAVADDEGQEWLVRVVNMTEMGSVGAALKTRDALLRTKAFRVVLVGICAGIPGKVEFNEVVIPKTVFYFESAKITADGEMPNHQTRECDPDVVSRADVHAHALLDVGLSVKADSRVMACGEKVVADEEFRRSLEQRDRKLTAIDMESYGVVRAADEAGRRATVIKAVCDMADGSKNDDHHQSAAEAAAKVLAQLVQRGAFKATR